MICASVFDKCFDVFDSGLFCFGVEEVEVRCAVVADALDAGHTITPC